MTEQNPYQATPEAVVVDAQGYVEPTEGQRTYMYITYALFALAPLIGGITALIGVILAYIKRDEMRGTVYEDHMYFLIKTFWVSLIGGIIGAVLAFVLIGFLILALLAIWYIVRVVVGVVKLIDNKPVTREGWMI
ncbi:putative membrane protein [Neisseria sp. HSC-16F19]|nr:hypothetical protein [Neisseria sp. HSC-16F19]MCP2041405.1 putative membrane protein [Neisseria sp. HSC-16F19]